MDESQKPESPPPAPALDASDSAIGRRLREAREARGLTQHNVSVRSKMIDPEGKGVSRTALIGYEAGTSRPGTRELRLLCETLLVSPSHVVYGSEQPFQTEHAALEGLRGHRNQLSKALQVAFLVMVLKDHEKDALLSLTASLAAHHLGDRRLSGLRATVLLLAGSILDEVRSYFSDLSDAEFNALPLSELVQRLSQGSDSNVGNRFKFDEEGNIVGGEQTYPDPEG